MHRRPGALQSTCKRPRPGPRAAPCRPPSGSQVGRVPGWGPGCRAASPTQPRYHAAGFGCACASGRSGNTRLLRRRLLRRWPPLSLLLLCGRHGPEVYDQCHTFCYPKPHGNARNARDSRAIRATSRRSLSRRRWEPPTGAVTTRMADGRPVRARRDGGPCRPERIRAGSGATRIGARGGAGPVSTRRAAPPTRGGAGGPSLPGPCRRCPGDSEERRGEQLQGERLAPRPLPAPAVPALFRVRQGRPNPAAGRLLWPGQGAVRAGLSQSLEGGGGGGGGRRARAAVRELVAKKSRAGRCASERGGDPIPHECGPRRERGPAQPLLRSEGRGLGRGAGAWRGSRDLATGHVTS